MHTYNYRLPRYSASFPVYLVFGDVVAVGLCEDISEAGLRGTFARPVPVSTRGLLSLNHPKGILGVEARVAYISDGKMVLRFLFSSEQERGTLRRFLSVLTQA